MTTHHQGGRRYVLDGKEVSQEQYQKAKSKQQKPAPAETQE
ncbi:hypothetical protein [Rheinheimera sp. 4Y26]|nr:hypothetical protein [Rheinheimera sp. 4Y26]MCT6700921.1 hypothetical protein [Rheinheimera sp. 4Y26]